MNAHIPNIPSSPPPIVFKEIPDTISFYPLIFQCHTFLNESPVCLVLE